MTFNNKSNCSCGFAHIRLKPITLESLCLRLAITITSVVHISCTYAIFAFPQ